MLQIFKLNGTLTEVTYSAPAPMFHLMDQERGHDFLGTTISHQTGLIVHEAIPSPNRDNFTEYSYTMYIPDLTADRCYYNNIGY